MAPEDAEREARRARREARRTARRSEAREERNTAAEEPRLERRHSRRLRRSMMSHSSGEFVDAPEPKSEPLSEAAQLAQAHRARRPRPPVSREPPVSQVAPAALREPETPPRQAQDGRSSRFGIGALSLLSRSRGDQDSRFDVASIALTSRTSRAEKQIEKANRAAEAAAAKTRQAEEAAERAAQARTNKAEKMLAAQRAKEEASAARMLAKEEARVANERRAEMAQRAKDEKKQLKSQLTEEKRTARELAQQQKADLYERRAQEKADAKAAVVREREEAEAARVAEVREAERNREQREIERRQRRLASLTPFRRRQHSTEIDLTPEHRHLLLRTLVMMVIQKEWEGLVHPRGIEMYGHPFEVGASTAKRHSLLQFGSRRKGGAGMPVPDINDMEEPLILRHMFQVHLRPFPGLDAAPVSFWRKRIQPVTQMFANCDFSSPRECSEMVFIRTMSLIGTQYLGLYFARGVGVRGPGELRGPGLGDPGTEEWGVGKQWGAGTVKRGLDLPYSLTDDDLDQIDMLFDGSDRDLWVRAGQDAARPDEAWSAFKETIIEKETGLEEMVSWLSVSKLGNLPIEIQETEEWVRNHVARAARWLLVESPSADDLFNFLRVAHTLFPYWPARQILHTANASNMVQLLLSLFLAQPAGTKSLLQRIIGAGITKNANNVLKEYIGPLRAEIGEQMLIAKIESYVRHKHTAESERINAECDRTGNDILTTILLSPAEPRLDSGSHPYVLDMQRCFAASPYRGSPDLAYPASTLAGSKQPPVPRWDASSADAGKARKFALLKLLLRELLKKRDAERFADVLSSNEFANVLKDGLSIVFFQGFHAVAEVADLSERLHDVQKLLDDVISVRQGPDNSVEAWIALATKHHEFVYFFVHECAVVAQPLWEWAQAGVDYLSLSTTDPANPADARAERIEVNLEEMLEDERLSNEDVEEIMDELDHLLEWSRWSKIRRELVRRRETLLSFTPSASGLSKDVLPDHMRSRVKDIDSLLKVLMKNDGAEPDTGLCDDVRGSERKIVPWAYFDEVDPLGQSIRAEPPSENHYTTPGNIIVPPSLSAMRKLVPLFRELLISKLPDWLDGRVNGAGDPLDVEEPQVPKNGPSIPSKLFKLPFGRS